MTRRDWDKTHRASRLRRDTPNLPVIGSTQPAEVDRDTPTHTRPPVRDWRAERDTPTWLKRAAD